MGKLKGIGFGSAAFLFLIMGVIPIEAEAIEQKITIDFGEEIYSVDERSFDLPHNAVIKEVKVNTGEVELYRNPTSVDVLVWDGKPVREEYNPYYQRKEVSHLVSGGIVMPETYKYTDIDGFEGILKPTGTPEFVNGYYEPPDSKYVDGQLTEKYDDGKYKGTLERYTVGTIYLPSDRRYVSNVVGKTITGTCTSDMGVNWTECGSVGNPASSFEYNVDRYVGTLSYQGYKHNLGKQYKREDGTWAVDYTIGHTYWGYVSRPFINEPDYRYRGTVKFEGFDSRTFFQFYEGTVYKGRTESVYHYILEITYEIDNEAPDGDLIQTPTAWTNQSVTLSLANVRDMGLAGFKHVTLPNGTTTNQVPLNYSVTSNGMYTFILEDEVGNKRNKTITVSNIDRQAPTGTLAPEKSGWTNQSYDLILNQITDTGGAGLDKVQLPNGSWISAKAGDVVKHLVSENGTYSFTIVDKAGNQTVKSVSVSNIDKGKPAGTVSYQPSANGLNMVVSATDAISGIKSIRNPNGQIVNSGQSSFLTTKSGEYEFIITDNAGNVTSLQAVAQEPRLTVVREGLDAKISVSKNYNQVPVIQREETGETFSGESLVYPLTKSGSYSFRVNDGGIWSQVVSVSIDDFQELVLPKVTITPITDWSNKQITLNITVTSSTNQRIVSVVMPNGQVTTASSFTYLATENGIYTFKATDARGFVGYGSIIVRNIDKKTPTIEVIAPTDWEMEDFDVKINVNNN